MKFFLTAALLLTLATSAHAADKLPVIASFSILGDIVQQIGGDTVTVTTLVGADSDTHTYQPTPADTKNIAAAKLVIVNGLGFEGWVDRLVKASGTKATVVTASQGVTSHTMEEDGATITDPHAWQDLANGRLYAKNIAAALITALPDQKAAIQARADAYDAELQKLDTDIRNQIASIPAGQHKIITSHDAFGYFGQAYNVAFVAPEGISTESQPTAADIARLTRHIKEDGFRTLFIENMANARLTKQIARDTGAKIGGTLYADALSPAGGPAATYVTMFRHNVPLLIAAMKEVGK